MVFVLAVIGEGVAALILALLLVIDFLVQQGGKAEIGYLELNLLVLSLHQYVGRL